MYCYHCGKKIDERKIEKKASSLEKNKEVIDENTKVEYICPRCGHLIHEGHDDTDMKSLSAAAHAEIQRGRNSFAVGMGNVCISVIGLILAIIFLRLSYKPGLQNQLVINCPEFYVSMILFVVGGVMLIVGGLFVYIGLSKKSQNEKLLKDISHGTFVQ